MKEKAPAPKAVELPSAIPQYQALQHVLARENLIGQRPIALTIGNWEYSVTQGEGDEITVSKFPSSVVYAVARGMEAEVAKDKIRPNQELDAAEKELSLLEDAYQTLVLKREYVAGLEENDPAKAAIDKELRDLEFELENYEHFKNEYSNQIKEAREKLAEIAKREIPAIPESETFVFSYKEVLALIK
ncbi:MAG: hypothetical protein ACK5VJ_01300 [Pseudomonadota bacterium]|jgi:hypothetical protein